VLSGLIKNEEGKSTEGLPGLSRIPVLGALFGSRDFKENRTELVILVRPSIVHENTMAGSEDPPRHLGDIKHD
jgi:pilus assembly protein CpaC